MEKNIRKALASHAKLAVDADGISTTQNLFDVGLTSFACVQLMMRLEEVFEVEFPDELLKKPTFETIAAIELNIRQLRSAETAPGHLQKIVAFGTLVLAGALQESIADTMLSIGFA
ncbi:hypothetical protein A6U87_15250 [Rhizobium sp. AC44/96]|uniref:acyl carrier protein n=1 Tax=unclassified Rhizobium TaxID=2613769 RepID=UPI00080F9044|nr:MULTISPECIES: acyl carrier protein [unclassified Rhizobium]MDM9623518.1 acyl carrier protein [Rhizobium sp. S96]OCJ04201.1 hypothetical protein A6U87_15250 [Rhizobium sp. AC44/96]